MAPSPRFALRSPVTDSIRVTVPSAGTLEILPAEAPSVVNGQLVSQTDTVAVNGLTTQRLFTAATPSDPARFVTTTPEGRTVTEEIDPAGRTTRLEVEGLLPIDLFYDAHGRLEEIVQGTRSTLFGYDGEGFLSSVTMRSTAPSPSTATRPAA